MFEFEMSTSKIIEWLFKINTFERQQQCLDSLQFLFASFEEGEIKDKLGLVVIKNRRSKPVHN